MRTALGGLREGARSGTFWLLAGSFFVCGASTNGLVGTHLIPAAHDHGVSEVTAASYLAAIGVFDIIGTTFSGWLTDRYDPRLLLFWYYGLRGLSLLALHSVLGSPSLGLLAFVVFYGLDWVATVPPTVALTADAFGRERVGILFGWIFAAHQFGAAFAAYGAGWIRTDAGQLPLGVPALRGDVHGRVVRGHADPHPRPAAGARLSRPVSSAGCRKTGTAARGSTRSATRSTSCAAPRPPRCGPAPTRSGRSTSASATRPSSPPGSSPGAGARSTTCSCWARSSAATACGSSEST